MANHRQYIRVRSDSHCNVADDYGDNYEAMLQDISLGGALVKVRDGLLDKIEDGDVCRLLLCINIGSCPIKYTCRVVRHDSVSMGVQFLTSRGQ